MKDRLGCEDKREPQLMDINESLLWNSAPSPWQNNGMV